MLLILAGITINLVIGQKGILDKTIQSGETYKKEQAKEILKLKIVNIQTKVIIEEKRDATLKDLKNILEKDSEITKIELDNNENPAYATVSINGYIFYVNDKLEIVDEIKPTQINWKFDYTGDYQEFIVPYTGNYQIECWGATAHENINGAYTKGIIKLEKDTKIYIYSGGTNNTTIGGYNGGGNSGTYGGTVGNGGAGATDIRLVSGEWNDFNSLKSRIMVAAGGAGVRGAETQLPYAGGLIGYNSRETNYERYGGNGGTQIAGGIVPANFSGTTGLTAGKFGVGGNGNRSIQDGFGCGRRRRFLGRFRWKWSSIRFLGWRRRFFIYIWTSRMRCHI